MHIRKRVWGHVLTTVTLVAFALPLASGVPLATPAAAQTAVSTISGVGTATPAEAINAIGTPHTVTFTCTAPVPAGAAPGTATTACANVTGSVTDDVTGAQVPVAAATCAGAAVSPTGGTLSGCNIPAGAATFCATVAPAGTFTFNPATGFCEAPVTAAGGAGSVTAAQCTAAGGTITTGSICRVAVPAADTATVTINPGAPHAYTITFTGYVAATVTCPTGFTVNPTTGMCTQPITLTFTAAMCTTAGGTVDVTGTICTIAPTSVTCPAGTTLSATATTASPCAFVVTAHKKYVEITALTITPTSTSTCLGGTLTFAEGLKSFFGPSCSVTAAASGTVVLKSGVNCAPGGGEPVTGTAAPAMFGPTATYQCIAGTLSVTGVTAIAAVPVTFSVSGPAGSSSSTTLSTLCAGSTTLTTIASVTGPGGVVTFCPTGPGTVTVGVCLGTAAAPLPNNQPAVCSSTISVSFKVNIGRAVPYVRWAGEKIVLTKCFGVGLAHATVEFTLKGNNPGLNATLLPTSLASATSATVGTTTLTPTSDNIFVAADTTGCASVIGLADGEGVMQVDAAVYSPGGTSPLVNEHAFEVFYLKFENVALENITNANLTTAAAITPYLSFIATVPTGAPTPYPAPFVGLTAAAFGAGPANATGFFPGAPGTGEMAGPTSFPVPLCATQFLRAMVSGYFEYPGDPSGRPAANIAIPGAPGNSAGSYTLPAGRWVLPQDWPLLATFAGFGLSGQPADLSPSSVLAWDLNSGYAFNTSENPDLCGNKGTLISPAVIESGAITDVELGPCVGMDAAGTVYTTAPAAPNCTAGETVGIGPFDPTQACTNPYPLTYSPAGSQSLAVSSSTTAGTVFSVGPLGPNSTYLPNGTLNEWDAPMPPAQVTFQLTSGIGFLAQVNKTGLYQFFLSVAQNAGGGCTAPYVLNATSGNCEIEGYPNPFYAEAIPASPLIPPVTNNGGYLWNSWGFTFGSVTTVVGTGPTSAGFTVAAGGYVPGQSTLATGVPGGTLGAALANPAPCPTATTPEPITVGSSAGFMAGMTAEVIGNGTYTTPNQTILTGLVVLDVPNTTTVDVTCASLAAAFAAAPTGTTTIGSGAAVLEAEQFGLPVPSGAEASFSVGQPVTIVANGMTFTTQVAAANPAGTALIDTTNHIVYVNNAEGLATAFGCATGLSRPFTGAVANAACEPSTLVPPGSVVSAGPAAGATAPTLTAPPHPYPFWQWVPGAPTSGARPAAATVYSDNHGEAVVALQTGITTTVPVPASGVCPAGFVPAVSPTGVTTGCFISPTSATIAAFPGVAAALKQFSAANPGCVSVSVGPTGVVVGTAPAAIGPHGPAANTICINTLGGIEFGAGAALGSTTIQAVADYPYTRGEHPPVASPPLTKVFTSAFAKDVTVGPAVAGPTGTGVSTYTVTVTAVDICGVPLAGEPIQVYALGNAGAAVLAPVSFGTLISATSNAAIVTVGAAGTATFSLEVLSSALGGNGLLVKVVFPLESIERFAVVVPGGPVSGTTAPVVYAPGWNMVGGPPGSNFSVAEALYTWNATGQAYVAATASAGSISSAPPACTGYWAFFAAAMSISLPVSSKAGDTATCTLAPGWNLVGNPFSSPASLPSGTTAYHWNGTSYDAVGQIPVGGSVWIFNSGTTSTTVTLTAT